MCAYETAGVATSGVALFDLLFTCPAHGTRTDETARAPSDSSDDYFG